MYFLFRLPLFDASCKRKCKYKAGLGKNANGELAGIRTCSRFRFQAQPASH